MAEPLINSYTSPVSEEPKTTTGLWKVLAILVGLLLVIGGIWSYFSGWVVTGSEPMQLDDPRGVLLMTMHGADAAGDAIGVTPFHYSFDNRVLNTAVINISSQEGQETTAQYDISPDTNWITFVAVHAHDVAEDAEIAVYRADARNVSTAEGTIAALQNADMISPADSAVKRFPSISDNGDVVYMAYSGDAESVGGPTDADEWTIHVVSVEGDDLEVTGGIYPKWVSDSEFIFLKTDGLYIYSLNDNTEAMLQPALRTVTTDETIAYAPARSMLAWSIPSESRVELYRSTKWGAEPPTFMGIVSVYGFDPVFDPEGNKLALSVASQNGEDVNAAVIVFDLDANVAHEPIVFPGHEVRTIRLNDWL